MAESDKAMLKELASDLYELYVDTGNPKALGLHEKTDLFLQGKYVPVDLRVRQMPKEK